MVPKVVRLADPAHVERAVFSTFPSPTCELVNPVRFAPETAGRVVDMDGTPEPSVTNTPEFAVAILERVLAAVVYTMVFVSPTEVEERTPEALLWITPAPNPERTMFPLFPPPNVSDCLAVV